MSVKKSYEFCKIMLDFCFGVLYVSSAMRRRSSVVEHVIGNDGVVSPILTSGTIFDNAPLKVLFLYVFQAFNQSDFINFEISDF